MTKKEVKEVREVLVCGICGCDIDAQEDWYRDTNDNGPVCEDCHGENYVVCDICGESVNINDENYYTDDWSYYCEDCVPARVRFPDLVEYYHDGHDGRYSRILRHNDDCDTFTIGFELERNGYDNDVLTNVEALASLRSDGLVHYERDGSLNDGGVECISQPFSYTWLQANNDTFKRIIDVMSDNDGWYDSECSFHIHVGREAFTTDSSIAKVCYFYRAFPEAVASLSNRRFNEWCERIQGTLQNVARGYHAHSRYQAVNLDNDNTVEFRLMGGSENPEELLRWIDFHYQLINQANKIGWAFCGNIEAWLDGFSDSIVGAMAKNNGLTEYLGKTIAPYETKARIQLWDRQRSNWYVITQYNNDNDDDFREFDNNEDVYSYCRYLTNNILRLDINKCQVHTTDYGCEIYDTQTGLYMLDSIIKKNNLLNMLVD